VAGTTGRPSERLHKGTPMKSSPWGKKKRGMGRLSLKVGKGKNGTGRTGKGRPSSQKKNAGKKKRAFFPIKRQVVEKKKTRRLLYFKGNTVQTSRGSEMKKGSGTVKKKPGRNVVLRKVFAGGLKKGKKNQKVSKDFCQGGGLHGIWVKGRP